MLKHDSEYLADECRILLSNSFGRKLTEIENIMRIREKKIIPELVVKTAQKGRDSTYGLEKIDTCVNAVA